MLKVALFTTNYSGEEREERLPGMLSEELREEEIEIIQFSSSDSEEKVAQAKKEADAVVLVIDAVDGINPIFSSFARMFFKNNIRPIVLITDFDSPDANVYTAEKALGNIWSKEDETLTYAELEFLTAYFSYYTCVSYDNKYKDNPGKGLSRCVFYADLLN